ncbi:MAG: hypothetical protein ACFFDY_03235 [Candidatus Thorarchaeota archaeon]
MSAFNCNLIDFNSNKNVYYIDEKIKVNASWELYYNPINEMAYIQIHILDCLDQVIWNSTKYNHIGFYEQNWTVNFNDIDLDFINDSITLYIKFFLFYFQIDTTNTMFAYLETIEIRILKRNITNELIGYKDTIKMGEILSFIARFYDGTSEIVQEGLNNISVQFFISFDDLIIFQHNYTTNTSGEIPIVLYSLTHLRRGQNLLIFSITNNMVYNDSIFTYEIFAERNDLIIEFITFNDELKNNENLELKLHFFYYINQSFESLSNYTMLIKIFDNKSVYFIKEYTTDQFGFMTISIAQEEFIYNETNHNFNISIFFNGTFMLENKTVIKSFKLIQDIYPEITNSFQVRFLSFISILVIVLVVFSYLITNKRSKNGKMLTELIFRY